MMMMVRVTELLLSLDTYMYMHHVYMYTLPVNPHALLSPSVVTVHIEETAYQVIIGIAQGVSLFYHT